MSKLSFIRFSPYDWINDTRELSPEAKGAWIDALCLMWNAPQRGRWQGTYQEFARATGIPWEIAPRVLDELGRKTADLTLSNNLITLENRRMIKEENIYENNRIRQKRFYNNAKPNANLTDKTLDVRRKTLDVKDKELPYSPLKGAKDKVGEWFEKTWLAYPKESRLGKKQALRHYKRDVKGLDDAKAVAKALEMYLKSKRVKDGFIQNASTWFNNWRDYHDDSQGRNSASLSGDEYQTAGRRAYTDRGGFSKANRILDVGTNSEETKNQDHTRNHGDATASDDRTVGRVQPEDSLETTAD